MCLDPSLEHEGLYLGATRRVAQLVVSLELTNGQDAAVLVAPGR